MSSLRDRWTSLPRAARWGLWGALIIVAYFAVIEPAVVATNRLSMRADQREAELAAFEAAQGSITAASNTVKLGVLKHGEVDLPGDAETRPSALNRLVSEMARKHNVTGLATQSQTLPLGPGALATKMKDMRIDRVLVTMRFDAEPEQVAALIADLERTSIVAGVSRVQITRDPSKSERKVSATIGVEAWIATAKKVRNKA